MTTIVDTFSGAGALSASWSRAPAGTILYTQSGGLLTPGGSGNAELIYWSANAFAGNQTAQITVSAMPATEWGTGPAVKVNSTTGAHYFTTYKAGRIFLSRCTDGTAGGPIVADTQGVSTPNIVVGDIIKVTATTSGANLIVKVFQNSTQLLSYTDTAPLTGTNIGLQSYYSDSAWRGDDFTGGDLVVPGPTINTQPSNQTVTAGATATFTVAATASGGGALSYQWQRNSVDISGATSASYTTPATTVTGGVANNGDAYRCNVTETGGTNPGTTASSAATLTVNAAGAKAGFSYYYKRGNQNV